MLRNCCGDTTRGTSREARETRGYEDQAGIGAREEQRHHGGGKDLGARYVYVVRGVPGCTDALCAGILLLERVEGASYFVDQQLLL